MKEQIWKPIKNYEGLYLISNEGVVKTVARKAILSNGRIHPIKEKIKIPLNGKNGYLYIMLSKESKSKGFAIHRLIAIHFKENPNSFKVVHHKNGNKKDNSLNNLEWTTSSRNNIDALEKNLRRTRSDMDITLLNKIKFLRSQKLTNKEISKIVGQSEGRVSGITSGKTYIHLQKFYSVI